MQNPRPTTLYPSVLEAAQGYLARGWNPTPTRGRDPCLKDWPRRKLTAPELPEHFKGGINIGVVLGPTSGDLVDVDIDCPEALAVANVVLPETGLITGHPDKPRSHHYYKSPSLKTRKFQDPEAPKGSKKAMLVEARGEGCQTLLPPSEHPDTHQNYGFDSDGEPTAIAADDLVKASAQLAGIALVARYWPAEGLRQDAAIALAGALCRAGVSLEEAQRLLRLVCQAAGDTELKKRVGAVVHTFKRIASDEPAFGFTKLAELIGKRVAGRALDWIKSSEVPADWELMEARELIAGMVPLLKADPKLPFQPEVVGALAVLRARDPAAWDTVRREMKKADVSLRALETEMRGRAGPQLHIVEPGETAPPRVAGEMVEGCPMPEQIIPAGFTLRTDATLQTILGTDPLTRAEVAEEVVVAHAPVLITGRLVDVEEDAVSLEVGYGQLGVWHRQIADRAVFLSDRRILDLASRGFPVSSANAKALVNYLHQLEAANLSQLPVSRTSSHLGWQGAEGEFGFLCGKKFIPPLPGGQEENKKQDVVFVGATGGDEQIVRAVHAKGSMKRWLKAVSAIKDHPKVLLGFYASFVPPLLLILRAPNFIIDLAGLTSRGKTTVLRVGASVWGDPDELQPDSLIGTWDSTCVYVERASAVLSGLPTFLDETQRARESSIVGKMLYEVASGRGRARGNVRSVATTKVWRTVLLSTGERPAVSFTKDSGTRARCIEVAGFPFGSVTDETAEIVTELNLAIKGNFGHGGAAFVEWLIRQRQQWEQFEQEYRDGIAGYTKQAPEGGRIDIGVLNRLAGYMAAIQCAALYVHEALDLPWNYSDPLQAIWRELACESIEATGEERALREIMSWAHSHMESFWGRHRSDHRSHIAVPAVGWSGEWDSAVAWESIGFYPHVLDKVLREAGYTPEAIITGWAERKWLDANPGRTTKRVRVQYERPHLIVVKREAVNVAEA